MTLIDVQVGEAVAVPYDPVSVLSFDTDWVELPKPIPVTADFSGAGALAASAKQQFVRAGVFSGGGTLSATAAEKPWTPLAISGLAVWIDPAQDTGIFTDGQAISSYTSHDSSGRVFTAHASYEPNFKIVGGKPRIEFIATSGVSGDGLWSDGYNPGTAGLTYVIVMQTAAPSNYGMIMTWGEPATGMEMRYEDGSYRIQCIANYSGGGPVLSSAFASAASTDYVFLLRQDTSANKFRLYINDTLQFDGGTVPLPNTAGRMRIGWREDGYYMNGLVAEVLVISGPISDSDRTKLMVYIRAKHGALPGV